MRPIEYFFQDIQKLIDGENTEAKYLEVLSVRRYIYKDICNIPMHSIPNKDSVAYVYEHRMQKATDLVNACHAIIYMEKQQKAFERQYEINRKEPPSILPEELPSVFFEELYILKMEYDQGKEAVSRKCRNGDELAGHPMLSKEQYIEGCRDIYNKCKVQPIPSVLMPVILTVFSTDAKDAATRCNIYSYLKFKERRLSEKAKELVLSLFSRICKLVEKWVDVSFELPVFRWDRIAYHFCRVKGLSKEDIAVVEGYFARYQGCNDLSKAGERELLKYTYGEDIRAIAKLCNYNAYIAMNYLPKDKAPRKGKRALEKLSEGKSLPKIGITTQTSDYLRDYFSGLYILVPSNILCYLMLVRCYHLSFDSLVDFLPGYEQEHEFFTEMEGALGNALRSYCDQIQRKYEDDPLLGFEIEGRSYSWLNMRKLARSSYQYQDVLKLNQYAKSKAKFTTEIIKNFTDEAYMEFISDVKNFHVDYFPMYLKCFCEKYCILRYEKAGEMEKCFLEDAAFAVILELLKATLQRNARSFLENLFYSELCRKDL